MTGKNTNIGSRGHSDSGRATLSGPPAVAPSGAGGAPSMATGGGKSELQHARGSGLHGQTTGTVKGNNKAQKTNSNRRGGGRAPEGKNRHQPNSSCDGKPAEEEAVDVTALVANFESAGALVSDLEMEAREVFSVMASPSAFDLEGDEFDRITATRSRPDESKGKRPRGSSGASAGSAGIKAAKKRMANRPTPNPSTSENTVPAADPYADLDPPTRPPKKIKGTDKATEQLLSSYSEATIRQLKLSIHSESRILRHTDYVLIDHALQVQLFNRALVGESTPFPIKSGIRDGVIYIVARNQEELDILENLLQNMTPPTEDTPTEDTPTDFIITRGDKAPVLKKMNCKVSNPFIGDHLDMLTVLLYRCNPTLKGTRLIVNEKIDRPFDKANTVLRCHVDLDCMRALKELGWRAKLNMGHADFWVPTKNPAKGKKNGSGPSGDEVEMTDQDTVGDGNVSAPSDGAAGQMEIGAPDESNE